MFVVLRDGSGYLQCVLTGRLVSNTWFKKKEKEKKSDQQGLCSAILLMLLHLQLNLPSPYTVLSTNCLKERQHPAIMNWLLTIGKLSVRHLVVTMPSRTRSLLTPILLISWITVTLSSVVKLLLLYSGQELRWLRPSVPFLRENILLKLHLLVWFKLK